MTIPGIALFLLLAQNAISQLPPATATSPAPPAAPASIEGVVAKAGTGESLSKVTVTLGEIRSVTSLNAGQRQTLGNTELISILMAESFQPSAVSSELANITGSTRLTMTTSSDGKFLFENLKPGTYTLSATLGGFAPAEYGQRGPNGRGTTITLKAGQKMQGISLAMTPGGTITGRVIDANGDPLSRAMVQAQKLAYQERGRSLVTVQTVLTDDRGEYRLFWLTPGQYYISATPSDDRMRTIPVLHTSTNGFGVSTFTMTSAAVLGAARDMGTGPIAGLVSGVKVTGRTLSNGDVIEEAMVQVFYPAALDVSTATPVEIRPGGITSGIDITTKPARVYRIRGVVINSATGQPTPVTSITLLPRNGPIISQPIEVLQTPNSSGFEIAGVVPGSYYLLVSSPQGAGQFVTAISPIEIQAANRDNVIISATPSVTIPGRIVAGGTISNTATNPPTFIVQLDPQTPGLQSGARMSARDGNFVLPALYPGDYRVRVTTPANTYPQSIRLGGQDVLRNGLHIDSPINETLEIVVAPNAGRLEGSVTAEKQKFANATVVLMPVSSLRLQTNLYQNVQTSAEGQFTFENIPPGSYKVFAWENVEAFAWFDAEFMRNFESRGTEIQIREGAKEILELTVIPR